jgi:hypothetical protein
VIPGCAQEKEIVTGNHPTGSRDAQHCGEVFSRLYALDPLDPEEAPDEKDLRRFGLYFGDDEYVTIAGHLPVVALARALGFASAMDGMTENVASAFAYGVASGASESGGTVSRSKLMAELYLLNMAAGIEGRDGRTGASSRRGAERLGRNGKSTLL